MKYKSLYITATALLWGAVAFAQSLKLSPVSDQYQLATLGMSANHRYICGLNVGSYQGFVWDTQAGSIVENRGDYSNCDFRSVSNDGVAYGILGYDDMVTTNAASFDGEGKVNIIETEMSQVFDVTPDGKIAVGCLLDAEMWWPTACLWREGERIMLPCPSEAECGIANDGANAQFISADGSVIVGYLQDWKSSRPAIIWRLQEDGSYEADVISKDLWELNYGDGKTYLCFQALGISENGQWICLAAQREADGNMPTPEFMVRMNLATGEILESETPVAEYFVEGIDHCYPSSIANDGTCIGSFKDEMGFLRGAIWKSDEKSPRLLADVYPGIEELTSFDGFMHLPIRISPDGKYIAGYACPVILVDGEPDYYYQAYLISAEGTDGIASIKTASLGNKRYDLMGRPLIQNTLARGIYIENGRKVLK